jgi:hypothetical protein
MLSLDESAASLTHLGHTQQFPWWVQTSPVLVTFLTTWTVHYPAARAWWALAVGATLRAATGYWHTHSEHRRPPLPRSPYDSSVSHSSPTQPAPTPTPKHRRRDAHPLALCASHSQRHLLVKKRVMQHLQLWKSGPRPSSRRTVTFRAREICFTVQKSPQGQR